MIALVASVVPWMTSRTDDGCHRAHLQDLAHARENAPLGGRLRGEDLGGDEAAADFQRDIGEGAADVDGDAGAVRSDAARPGLLGVRVRPADPRAVSHLP